MAKELNKNDVANHKLVKKVIDRFGKPHDLRHEIEDLEDEVIITFYDKIDNKEFGTITLKKKK